MEGKFRRHISEYNVHCLQVLGSKNDAKEGTVVEGTAGNSVWYLPRGGCPGLATQ